MSFFEMNSEPAWTYSIVVAELPPQGMEIELLPNEETRARLARYAGVLAVPSLTAKFKIVPDGAGGAMVVGSLNAIVRQNCVVSLESFDNSVHEEILLRFVPEGTQPHVTEKAFESGEEDPQDVVKGGMLDLGALTSEFLALGIDPYPRKPGVVFTPPADEKQDEDSSAFAALAKLKEKRRQGD
jgi:uncharacterized metal-binding protein YceD (DUF177 family)